jgi:hypothetical protein
MHAPLFITALLLFGSMFLPLPSPVGLALSLWAVGAGVALPAVLLLYVLQDVLTYTALGRLLPRIKMRFAGRTCALWNRVPPLIRRALTAMFSPAGSGGAGLFSAALLSFYAGAILGALRDGSPLHSALIVIGTDVMRYANGLAVALGAAFLLPSSPYSIAAASLLGFATAPLLRLLAPRTRHVTVLIPIGYR